MAKEKLNAKTDTPTRKSDLTKAFMLDYLTEFGTAEDVIWYMELLKANTKQKKSSLDDKMHDVLDMKVVHDEFAARFFPSLGTKNADDYMAKVQKLLAAKKAK